MIGGLRRTAALALALLGLAAVLTVTPVEAATIKPGRPCSIVGEQIVQGPWTFTCTLKKGKRVWVRKRTALPTGSWFVVAQRLQEAAQARPRPSVASTFAFFASPTVPKVKADQIATEVRSAYAPWLAVAPIADGFPVFLLDERSKDWYLERSSHFPDDNCADSWWDRMSPNSTTLGGAVCFGHGQDWTYMAFLFGSELPSRDPLGFAHEVVHVAQTSLLGLRGMEKMECWLGEGMAQVYSVALGSGDLTSPTNAGRARAARAGFLLPLTAMAPEPARSSPEYWLDIIRRSEDRSTEMCYQTGLGYSLGYLVTERLLEEFGEEGFLLWLRETRISGDSDTAFEVVFGITQDAWYEQSAAPYVAREASMLLRW